MLELHNLSKEYRGPKGKTHALRDVTVEIQPGITGLIGPNGSGKSTLMRLLTTIERPTSGELRLNGQPITGKALALYRLGIGYVPQDVRFVPSMSLTRSLEYAGWVAGLSRRDCLKRIPEVLQHVHLEHALHQPVSSLSGGQNRRLGIAAALLHEPQILFFDEPTAGLDPQSRLEVREILQGFGKEVTVVISSHLADDIARLSDHIIALDQGGLVFSGQWNDILEIAQSHGGENQSSDPLEVVLGYLAQSTQSGHNHERGGQPS